MWLFKSKTPESKPEERRYPIPVAVGERFKYLGVEMVCTQHEYMSSMRSIAKLPVIKAEYVIETGEVRQHAFWPCEWKALEAEMSRP